MRKKNFKIKMLVGNRLKIHVGASFEISSTLVWTNYGYMSYYMFNLLDFFGEFII